MVFRGSPKQARRAVDAVSPTDHGHTHSHGFGHHHHDHAHGHGHGCSHHGHSHGHSHQHRHAEPAMGPLPSPLSDGLNGSPSPFGTSMSPLPLKGGFPPVETTLATDLTDTLADLDQKDPWRVRRFLIILCLTSSFFLVEVTVGIISDSITLIADSLHMFSDALALIVGLWAVRYGERERKKRKRRMERAIALGRERGESEAQIESIKQKHLAKVEKAGSSRAETIGALINSVFLLSVCLDITLEAIQRFFFEDGSDAGESLMKNSTALLYVGILGLLINLFGIVLFLKTGHTACGHSCGSGGCPHTKGKTQQSSSHKAKGCGHDHSHGHGSEKSACGHGHHEHPGHGHHHEPHHHEQHLPSPLTFTPAKRSSLTFTPDKRFTTPVAAHIRPHLQLPTMFGHKQPQSPNMSPKGLGENPNMSLVEGRHQSSPPHSHGHSHQQGGPVAAPKKERDLNSHGVFLHIAGDALGSVNVIISALIIKYGNGEARFLVDPICSLLMVGIILYNALPLARKAVRKLLKDDEVEDEEDASIYLKTRGVLGKGIDIGDVESEVEIEVDDDVVLNARGSPEKYLKLLP